MTAAGGGGSDRPPVREPADDRAAVVSRPALRPRLASSRSSSFWGRPRARKPFPFNSTATAFRVARLAGAAAPASRRLGIGVRRLRRNRRRSGAARELRRRKRHARLPPSLPACRRRAVPRRLPSARAAPPIEHSFDGPREATTPATRVERVYPSADVLPEQQLRLYIYFSAPMSRGEVGAAHHLSTRAARPEGRACCPARSCGIPNNQRLTMTFDPGRIKRGLDVESNDGTADRGGPALHAGHRSRVAGCARRSA